MICVPPEIQRIFSEFLMLFSAPVYGNALILMTGALLATRQRTVTSCLRAVGLKDEEHFTNYHRVLNASEWDALKGAKIMFGLVVALIPGGWPLTVAVDETIERRNGEKIKAKGCYRDAVRSSSKHVIRCFGLKWIGMMLIVPVPWSDRPWALPFLTVLAPSPAADEAAGRRHKTTVDWATQMIVRIRRWEPERAVILIGDGAYAAVSLALRCVGFPVPVTLVSRLRLDAALYDDPPPDQPGKRGPKPKKGKRQDSPEKRAEDPSAQWEKVKVRWYDGAMRTLEVLTGVSLWYTPCFDPVRIRWVVVRDPEGKLRTEAFFCTDTEAEAEKILRWFVLRWNIEVTFQELRAHLGFETQRQWSDKAVARTAPSLFALFSLTVLMAIEIIGNGTLPVMRSAWYRKPWATFSDVIALVRRHILSFNYMNSSENGDLADFGEELFNIMLERLCHGT